MRTFFVTRRIALAMIPVFLFSSCAAGKHYTPPPVPALAPDELVSADTLRFEDVQPLAAWWQAFDDPQLAALVDEALHYNLDVKIALANVARTRARLGGVRADRLPTMGAGASYGLDFQS